MRNRVFKTVCIIFTIVFILASCSKADNNLNFGKKMVKTEAMVDILTELSSKTADVGIMDSIMAGYYMSQDTNYSSKLMIVDNLVLAEEEYGIAGRKEAQSTIYNINKALMELSSSGKVGTIAEKYGLKADVLINPNASAGNPGSDDDFAKIKENGEIKVGYTVFAPIAYTDEHNNFVGFDIDLARAVAEYLELNVEFVEIEWASKELELASKNIDLIWNGMTITPERKASMSISVPYLANRQVAVIRQSDAKKYTDTASMSKAVIAVESGSAGQSVVEKAENK